MSDTTAPPTAGGWFDSLGKPVSPTRRGAALDMLTGFGYDEGQAAMVLSVVCREMEHDNPDRAQRYLRSWLNDDETMVMRTLATLCAADAPDPDDDYPDPSADGFYPYWFGRVSEALRYVLANPDDESPRDLARETLAAFDQRCGR